MSESATDSKPSRDHRALGPRLVLASHNPGKVSEIAALLEPLRIMVVGAGELGLAEPEETGKTFQANAELKARAAVMACNLPALADDSGLVVPALGGDPGIYSARWAGPEKDFGSAMERVEQELTAIAERAGRVDRGAYFICVLALCFPDGACETFEGRVHGTLVWPPRGNKGFGYDPMFIADGHSLTFGQMEPAAKHAISHRTNAFRQLLAARLAPELKQQK
jgi:XTP/dITP diphosphohydrolase